MRGPPARQPIGLHLAQVAKVVSRAFDDALAQAGGSLPIWLVLISLKSAPLIPLTSPSAGLVTRRRDPRNRRIHVVELTGAGDTLFFRLRDTASAFDQRLRHGLSEQALSEIEDLLTRLRANVT